MACSRRCLALVVVSSLGLLQCDAQPAPDRSELLDQVALLREAPRIVPAPEDVEPTPLIGEFVSLISLEEAIARTDGLPYETISNKTRPRRGSCPGQHRLDLKITRYWDLGSRGTLILNFYNDKLTRAWFMTGDHAGYRQRYFEHHNANQRNRWKPNYIRPATQVLTSIMGNQGVIARDTRMWAHVDSVDRACNQQVKFERGRQASPKSEPSS